MFGRDSSTPSTGVGGVPIRSCPVPWPGRSSRYTRGAAVESSGVVAPSLPHTAASELALECSQHSQALVVPAPNAPPEQLAPPRVIHIQERPRCAR